MEAEVWTLVRHMCLYTQVKGNECVRKKFCFCRFMSQPKSVRDTGQETRHAWLSCQSHVPKDSRKRRKNIFQKQKVYWSNLYQVWRRQDFLWPHTRRIFVTVNLIWVWRVKKSFFSSLFCYSFLVRSPLHVAVLAHTKNKGWKIKVCAVQKENGHK